MLRFERLESRRCCATADLYEPDDTVGLAQPIALNGVEQVHSLPFGDQDWVSFRLQEWSDVQVRLTTASDAYPYPELFRRGKTLDSIGGDCRFEGKIQRFTLSPGEYAIKLGPISNEVNEYRLAVSASSTGDPLARSNFVQLAGEGQNTVQFSPQGTLAQLLWFGNELIFRTRESAAGFREEWVTSRSSCTDPFSPRDQEQAHLLYTEDGIAHILMVDDGALLHFQRAADGWTQSERVVLPTLRFSIVWQLVAAVDGNDLHVFFTEGDWADESGRGVYGTNRSGPWQFETAIPSLGIKTQSYFTSYSLRYLSLAIDPQGAAHLTYTPEFREPVYNGYTRPYNQLAYASNESGSWTTRVIHQPADDSGESGIGASIAIGPDGQPAIAQFYVDRAPTGSASFSRLQYHRRGVGGAWSTQTVATAPDGYVAGDGARFTGYAPQLKFDGLGRPHIAFSDHASQHFPAFGADEFAGQIRHAVLIDGNWLLETVVRQSDPLRNQLNYPAFTLYSNEIAFAASRKLDQLNPDLSVSKSDHYFAAASLPQTGLTIGLAAPEIVEGNRLAVSIRRHNASIAAALTVSLSHDAPGELNWPSSVTIAAGQSSAEVELVAIDDRQVDGTRLARLSASAPGFLPGKTILPIRDAPGVLFAGLVYADADGDATRASGEAGLSDRLVYLDLNRNGQHETAEPSVRSDSTGRFQLAHPLAGTYWISAVAEPGWVATAPLGNAYEITLRAGESRTAIEFGQVLTGFKPSAGSLVIAARGHDSIRVAAESTGSRRVTVERNGVFDAATWPVASAVRSLLILGGDGDNFIDVGLLSHTDFPNLGTLVIRDYLGSDQVIGSPFDDVIDLVAAGSDGVLQQSAQCGSDRIEAGAGNDRVEICSLPNSRVDGGPGFDRLGVDGAGANLDWREPPSGAYAGLEQLDAQGIHANRFSVDEATSLRWAAVGRVMEILTDWRDEVAQEFGWRLLESVHDSGNYWHIAGTGSGRLRLRGGSYLQNPLQSADTNHDDLLTPLDAVLVINELNVKSQRLTVPTTFPDAKIVPPPTFVDVSGDALFAPLDAILVINKLNAPRGTGAEGETERVGGGVASLQDGADSSSNDSNPLWELALAELLYDQRERQLVRRRRRY
jgi:hypothetical protein